MTQLALVAGILVLLCGVAYWLYRRGSKDAQADHMQQVNDDAYKATKVREEVEHMSSDGVRDALRMRARR